jgi:4-hydroxy-3-polyprenylbenzoate decarboxylase
MSVPAAVSDLRQFLTLLENRGELHRITAEVDPQLEIAAITDRVCKGAAGGQALLFQRVRGYQAPVATNLFGSARRAAWAVGVNHAEDAAERLAQGLAGAGGDTSENRMRCLLQRPEFAPRLQPQGICHSVVMDQPDLFRLPALHCWPGDGGSYLTLPQVYTRHPDGGIANCGMYRVQLSGSRQASIHWRSSSDAARHCQAWHMRNLPMPVSIALGGDPAMMFAAAFPLPPDINEAALAALLRGHPMDMTPSKHSDLPVPAHAEYVIEGLVWPGETAMEGPFGNHTGFYQPSARVPLLRVTNISHRPEPIFATTVVGPPPMENCHLGKLAERLILRLLRIDHPDIVDIHMPVEGIFHGVTLISVRPGTCGRSLLQALWQSGPLHAARLLVVAVDGNCHDPATFFWRTLNSMDPARDLQIQNGRLGIDATVEPAGRKVVKPDEEITDLVQRRWAEYGLK